MCDHGTVLLVNVKIPADLSHSGETYWKDAKIDGCIAPLVAALQLAGIDMRGSCCGHGERDGEIVLADGRGLLVKSAADYTKHMVEA